jgi:lactam utilization protein B
MATDSVTAMTECFASPAYAFHPTQIKRYAYDESLFDQSEIAQRRAQIAQRKVIAIAISTVEIRISLLC